MLVDTHCHLDFPPFTPDRDAVICRAKLAGISRFINIGSTIESSAESVKLAQKYPEIFASVGVHPHDADSFNRESEDKLRKLAEDKKVVAIGETGLDYYRNLSGKESQREVFNKQISLAKEKQLPLVIHSRQAEDEVIGILKNSMPLKAVIHCFSGSREFLKQCLDCGFFISFTCNITYKKSQDLREIVSLTPPDRLLLETDCPYLSPEGFRGKRNEPFQVKLLAEEISRIKGLDFEEVARFTTQNAINFFNLK